MAAPLLGARCDRRGNATTAACHAKGPHRPKTAAETARATPGLCTAPASSTGSCAIAARRLAGTHAEPGRASPTQERGSAMTTREYDNERALLAALGHRHAATLPLTASICLSAAVDELTDPLTLPALMAFDADE